MNTPTPAINAFLDTVQPAPSPARAEAISLGACRVCLKQLDKCLSSECPTGRRCHYRELANQRFGTLNAALNPETHCLQCGELLSVFGHCWQHHWPPMDPAQDKPTTQTATATPNMEQEAMIQIRTYEFDKGFLHLERRTAEGMSEEEIEEMYGPVLSVKDGEMPEDEFFNLLDFREI